MVDYEADYGFTVPQPEDPYAVKESVVTDKRLVKTGPSVEVVQPKPASKPRPSVEVVQPEPASKPGPSVETYAAEEDPHVNYHDDDPYSGWDPDSGSNKREYTYTPTGITKPQKKEWSYSKTGTRGNRQVADVTNIRTTPR